MSFWTVAMQALMSGYLCGIYLVTAILLGKFSCCFADFRKYCCALPCNNFHGVCTHDVRTTISRTHLPSPKTRTTSDSSNAAAIHPPYPSRQRNPSKHTSQHRSQHSRYSNCSSHSRRVPDSYCNPSSNPPSATGPAPSRRAVGARYPFRILHHHEILLRLCPVLVHFDVLGFNT